MGHLLLDDEFVQEERRRKKKRHVLGPATMGEREAEKVRDEFLRPLNQGLINIGSATNFEDYLESVYKPVILPTMAKSTRDRTMSVDKNYRLRSITTPLGKLTPQKWKPISALIARGVT
jgi:hypothetical protein